MTPSISSTADRIENLFDHLGLERAHVVACMSGDWGEFITKCADRMCSFTVVAPHLNKGIPDNLNAFNLPSLVITGDQGAPAKRARNLAENFGRGELFELRDYASPAWADTIADRTEEVTKAIGDFVARADRECGVLTEVTAHGDGEVAGIRYRIQGQGPAMVLMPLSLAPSQWDPLVSRLSDHYTIVQLGGPRLGVISLLEGRAKSGYGDLVSHLLNQTCFASGETILEVGCGSGALARARAKRMDHGSSIVATDINPYLLSEARALAGEDGLSETIKFEEANAEALPYSDAQFDVAFCCTVLEEGDANRMVAELARVTRPGGRIAVMTRALDVDWWANLSVPPELKRKIDALGPSTGAGVGEHGCADSSLYSRLITAGLTPMMMGPQFAIYKDGERLDDILERLVAGLSGDDAQICRDAIRQTETDGVLFVAEPFHCAVARR